MYIIKQPKKLHSEFLKNPQRFLRDFCNISGESNSPFIVFQDKIEKLFLESSENPFSDATLMFSEDWVPENLDKVRFMHLDLAQNKCGAGLSCAYSPFFVNKEVREKGNSKIISVPYIKFDFAGRIKAAPGEEVQIEDVEQIIYDLTYRGIILYLITFDRFASLQMKQRLQAKGYTCTEMSIQRTANKVTRCFRDTTHPDGIKRVSTNRQYLAGMNAFKEVLYEDRLSIPFHPILKDEIKKAYIDLIKNIVIPLPGMTIDILHSVAGSIYDLVNNIGVIDNSAISANSNNFEDDYYKRHGFTRTTKTEDGKEDFTDTFYEQEYFEDLNIY